MEKNLNLALKKDVFDGLKDGSTSVIIIEKTNWWNKRLVDIDTGRFKDFTTVIASCGSANKCIYDIVGIELKNNHFFITVMKLNDVPGDETPNDDSDGSDVVEVNEPETITPEIIEPEIVNPVVVNENGNVTQKPNYILSEEQKKKIVERYTKFKVQETIDETHVDKTVDLKKSLWNVFNKFCELKDVYVVSTSNVVIRNNGHVLGCMKRLIADRDADVRFDFVKKEFVKFNNLSDSEFATQIMTYLNNLLRGNYLFINKRCCGFSESPNGELTFVVYAVGKKKYLFDR